MPKGKLIFHGSLLRPWRNIKAELWAGINCEKALKMHQPTGMFNIPGGVLIPHTGKRSSQCAGAFFLYAWQKGKMNWKSVSGGKKSSCLKHSQGHYMKGLAKFNSNTCIHCHQRMESTFSSSGLFTFQKPKGSQAWAE